MKYDVTLKTISYSFKLWVGIDILIKGANLNVIIIIDDDGDNVYTELMMMICLYWIDDDDYVFLNIESRF